MGLSVSCIEHARPFTHMTGIELIDEERWKQISEEGYDEKHDDLHMNGEIRDAAIAYAMVCDDRAGDNAGDIFPWEGSWNPSPDPVKNLVRAGALIAAEIDRIQRIEK